MSFDVPQTLAMARFLEKEGPDGTGRVVGFSAEGADGFFVYTVSAQWCDDNGSGTFHGQSETAAIRAFRQRVQPGNGCPEYPQPAAATGGDACDVETPESCRSGKYAAIDRAPGSGPGFKSDTESALAPCESHATVWASEAPGRRPLATISRPARYHGDGLFTLCDVNGELVKSWTRMPTVRAVRQALEAVAEARVDAIRNAGELAPAELDARAVELDADAGKLEAKARGRGVRAPGTPGRALRLNLAALQRQRAAALRGWAAEYRATLARAAEARAREDGPAIVCRCFACTGDSAVERFGRCDGSHVPRSLSAAATPAELARGYDADADGLAGDVAHGCAMEGEPPHVAAFWGRVALGDALGLGLRVRPSGEPAPVLFDIAEELAELECETIDAHGAFGSWAAFDGSQVTAPARESI